jgi:hypothetical protein
MDEFSCRALNQVHWLQANVRSGSLADLTRRMPDVRSSLNSLAALQCSCLRNSRAVNSLSEVAYSWMICRRSSVPACVLAGERDISGAVSSLGLGASGFLLIGHLDQHKTRPPEGGQCTWPDLGKPQSIGAGRCLDYRILVRGRPGLSLIWVNVGPSAPVKPKDTHELTAATGRHGDRQTILQHLALAEMPLLAASSLRHWVRAPWDESEGAATASA